MGRGRLPGVGDRTASLSTCLCAGHAPAPDSRVSTFRGSGLRAFLAGFWSRPLIGYLLPMGRVLAPFGPMKSAGAAAPTCKSLGDSCQVELSGGRARWLDSVTPPSPWVTNSKLNSRLLTAWYVPGSTLRTSKPYHLILISALGANCCHPRFPEKDPKA